ncbi:hypothetical protein HN587_00565 [Candidatus Woesearchaeota archaeon]|jgi:hypothetical protein|nr:hypothetical protein [Candidatus Woesearchaeota archaeon]
MKYKIIILGILLLFLVGCVTQKNLPTVSSKPIAGDLEDNSDQKTFSELIFFKSSDSMNARNFTFHNCDYLDKQTSFTGIVKFEECGKNGLGGYPSSGSYHCYYGIELNDGCVVYYKSQLISTFNMSDVKTHVKFSKDQQVTIQGEPQPHYSHYCGDYSIEEEPECLYVVVGPKWLQK